MSPSSPPTPSMRPVGVPPSGNGKYIILVVLLLLAMGVLVLVKMKGSSDEPPPKVASLYDAAPTPHDESDIPPPPPPDEPVPDSGPNIRYVIVDPCAASAVKSCTGKITDELNTMLNARARAAHRCYDTALEQDGTLKGHITVHTVIAANGRMCSAAITNNDMGTNQVAACVQNTFARTGSLPVPKGGCVSVDLPISFVPGGK